MKRHAVPVKYLSGLQFSIVPATCCRVLERLEELLHLLRARRPIEGAGDISTAPISHRLLGSSRRQLRGPARRDLLNRRRKRFRQEHTAADLRRNSGAHLRHDVRARPGRGAAGTRLGFQSRSFPARDNVYLNGAILGFSNKEMDRRFPEIAAFAEIGDFINQPVKTYSSGMVVRLAFAVAIHVDPEILLVDEALAVGDVYFRQRCMRKVHELRARGITILFVSHATEMSRRWATAPCGWSTATSRRIGRTDLVVTQYLAAMSEKDASISGTRAVATHPAAPILRRRRKL